LVFNVFFFFDATVMIRIFVLLSEIAPYDREDQTYPVLSVVDVDVDLGVELLEPDLVEHGLEGGLKLVLLVALLDLVFVLVVVPDRRISDRFLANNLRKASAFGRSEILLDQERWSNFFAVSGNP